jgi:membrane protein
MASAHARRLPRFGGDPVAAARAWFTDRAWRLGPDAPRAARAAAAVSRLGYAVVRGFLENRLTLRAAALTYFSVLSLVPLLAFAFAVLKGLGAYGSFVDGTVQPWLQRTFGGNVSLLAAVEYVFRFVDRTNVSTLGVVGLLTLIYTSISLISNVESSFNVVWGAHTQRPFLRQVTDYVTLLVTTPILVLVATTFATAAQSSQLVEFLRGALQLGALIDRILQLTSVVVVATALFALFAILPNVHVRPVSAAMGAAVAALLWQLVLVLYVHFQMGVASYNALYSVLGTIPVFFVWMYLSWLVVLVGAQVAAAHQNGRVMGERFVSRTVDQELRERLAVALAAIVAGDFRAGRRRPEAELGDAVQLPRATAAEIVISLVKGGILARAVVGRDTFLLPARDPVGVRVSDVRAALRREAEAEPARPAVEARVPARLREVLDGLEEEARRSPWNRTLLQLGELVEEVEPAPPAASAAPSAAQATSTPAPVADDER